jgi:hypothetical protein
MPLVGTLVWLKILAWGLLGLALLIVSRFVYKRAKKIRFWRGGCLVHLVALAVLLAGVSTAWTKIAEIVRAKRVEKALRASVAEYGASSRVMERLIATNLALIVSPLFVNYRERHAPLDGSAPEPEVVVLQTLAELGAARLDAASLRRSAELRQQLARLSPEACRGLWTNQLDPAQRLVALNVLADPELDSWFALESRAAKLELAGTVRGDSVSFERLEQAVEALVERLPAGQASWLRQVWRTGPDGDPHNACLAYLAIADNKDRVRSDDYAVLTRYLAAPNSIVRPSRTNK